MKNPDFSIRSNEHELMDQTIDSIDDLFVNLKELEFINIVTGGRHTYKALSKIMKQQSKTYHIADIGFGAGDMLNYILKNKPNQGNIMLSGVDLMPEAKMYVDKYHPELEDSVAFNIGDYKDFFAQNENIDIAIAGLFCHHLTDDQIIEFFQIIQKNCKVGAVVNDLHRAPLAYYGIKYPTQWFSKSRFTKNDAPLSVLRGFKRSELEYLLKKAGILHYTLEWKWAFRYVLTIYTHE
jgi:ubiquinone/menaquinone biosynthesis C-methylase UbiE